MHPQSLGHFDGHMEHDKIEDLHKKCQHTAVEKFEESFEDGSTPLKTKYKLTLMRDLHSLKITFIEQNRVHAYRQQVST